MAGRNSLIHETECISTSVKESYASHFVREYLCEQKSHGYEATGGETVRIFLLIHGGRVEKSYYCISYCKTKDKNHMVFRRLFQAELPDLAILLKIFQKFCEGISAMDNGCRKIRFGKQDSNKYEEIKNH